MVTYYILYKGGLHLLYTEWIASIARVASKDFCCKYQ